MKITKLPKPEYDGDWHDKPLKWQFQFGTEVQKFSTAKEAKKYVSCRRKVFSESEAIHDLYKMDNQYRYQNQRW